MTITTFATAGDGATSVLTHDVDFPDGCDVALKLSFYNGTGGPTAVDVNGTAAVADATNNDAQLWRAKNVAGGGATVTVTNFDASGTYLSGAIQDFPAGTLDTLEAVGNAYNNNGSDTKSITSTGGSPLIGDLVIAVDGRQATSVDSGFSTSFSQASGLGFEPGSGFYKTATADGAQTATFHNADSSNTTTIIAVYRAAVGSTHDAGGDLVSGASAISGTATRHVLHQSSGSLAAGAASVSGSAAHSTGLVTHEASGDLVAGAASVSGAAVDATGENVAIAAAVWAHQMPDGRTAGEILVETNLMAKELWRVHGLDITRPLVVATNSRAAGDQTQSITEAGGVVTVRRT